MIQTKQMINNNKNKYLNNYNKETVILKILGSLEIAIVIKLALIPLLRMKMQ